MLRSAAIAAEAAAIWFPTTITVAVCRRYARPLLTTLPLFVSDLFVEPIVFPDTVFARLPDASTMVTV